MPDADDFDVEELRRLLRGENGRQPGPAPEETPQAPVAPAARRKTGKAGVAAKGKPGVRRKKA